MINEAIDRIVERRSGMSRSLALGILRQQREYVETASDRGRVTVVRLGGIDGRQQALQLARDVDDSHEVLTLRAQAHIAQLRVEHLHRVAIELIRHVRYVNSHEHFVNGRCNGIV